LELLPVLLIASLAAFLLSVYFIYGLGEGIEHVAIATVIAYILYAAGMMIVTARHLPTIRNLGSIIAKIFGPFLYVVAVAFILGDFFTLQGKSMGQCFIIVAAFCLFALPLLILVEKETRLLSHARAIMFGKMIDRGKT
jgi:Na+-driven multidrug efflux pump